MKVSVIIPTFRRDWELKRALHSLASQTFSDFEMIIVDDNCDLQWNQKVEAIISDFKEAYPEKRMTYLQNPSRHGSAETRNRGINAAKGEYVTFLDDDDEYLPKKIERQYGFMVENQLDYSLTDLDLYYDNGRLSEHRSRPYIKKTDRQSLLQYHFMYHLTGTDTIMFRKTYLEQIGGFPPIDLGDEFYLMQRAIESDGKFGYLEGCDVRAYVHVGQGGLSSGEGRITGENQLFEHKKKYFHLLSEKSIRYIKMRHYAVLSFAGLRMHHYGYFIKYGFFGFLSAPIQCIAMLIDQHIQKREWQEAEMALQESA